MPIPKLNFGLMNDGNMNYFDQVQTGLPKSTPVLNTPRLETDYTTARNKYMNNIISQKGKVSRKALKYFDQLWDADAGMRELQILGDLHKQQANDLIAKYRQEFNLISANIERDIQDLEALNKEAAGYTYDPTKGWVAPKPVTKPLNEGYWLRRAQDASDQFKSIDDVIKWLLENGLVADGKFGEKSLAKWNELFKTDSKYGRTITNNAGLEVVINPDTDPMNDPAVNPSLLRLSSSSPINKPKEQTNWFSRLMTLIAMNTDPAVMTAAGWNRDSNGNWDLSNINNADVSLLRDNLGTISAVAIGGFGANNLFKSSTAYPLLEGRIGLQKLLPEKTSGRFARAMLENIEDAVVMNNGEILNKFQQGGTMNNQEELQKAFIAFLILDAQAQGIQIQSQELLLLYVQLLGEQGLQAKQQEFMLKMQGGQMAKLGAKLAYYKKLKGSCPEGEEMLYFKEGGYIKCKCGKKMQKGGETKPVKKNAVLDFKDKRKSANKYPARLKTAKEKFEWDEKRGNNKHVEPAKNRGVGKN